MNGRKPTDELDIHTRRSGATGRQCPLTLSLTLRGRPRSLLLDAIVDQRGHRLGAGSVAGGPDRAVPGLADNRAEPGTLGPATCPLTTGWRAGQLDSRRAEPQRGGSGRPRRAPAGRGRYLDHHRDSRRPAAVFPRLV